MCAEAGTGRDGEQEPGRLLPERYLTLPGALQTPRTEKPLVHYRADGEDGFTVAKVISGLEKPRGSFARTDSA